MRRSAKRVWYAGDDDQAVHRWMGVNVEQFIHMCDNTEVLQQSYRVPILAHHVANKVVNRIDDRLPKTWFPTKEEGELNYHMHWYDVNMDQGSWTILARTNRIIGGIKKDLQEDGYLFEHRGRSSLDYSYLEGMEIWKSLVQGESLPITAIKELYRIVPKQGTNAIVKRGFAKSLDFIDPESILSYDDLVQNHGLIASKDTPSTTVVNMTPEEQQYYRALVKRGEDVKKPRITLSTIHAMKGGEDDNIMLLTESAYPCVETQFPDDEHRVFYTGITRTKKQLHIIETGSKYRYNI